MEGLGGGLDVKRLGSEVIIWGGSSIVNYNGLSIGRSGGTSDVKRARGELVIWLDSKICTYDGILMGAGVYLTVGKFEVYILRLLGGVLVGWSLRKYVESLLGIILVSGKGSVEGNIVVLLLGDTNGVPPEIVLSWNNDFRAWK